MATAFFYLSKKVAIPGGSKIATLSFNPEHGWLACGAEGGLLKVLRLDAAAGREAPVGPGGVRGIAASANLSMNHTLEGHNGTVNVAVWNPQHRKLTTADAQGLIIVWLLHKGTWFEEMINNRGKSTVRDMRWRANGQEICICYEDGHVILGTVDGNRLWSRDFESRMSHVEWAPDGRWLLFASAVDGSVTVYTHQGVRVGNLELHALQDVIPSSSSPSSFIPVVALEWYDGAEGYAYPDIPCLAIAFENGRVQLMREADDPKPLILDTGLRLTQAKWNTSGTILAVAGLKTTAHPSTATTMSEVQFYTPFGKYVTAMKIPGATNSSITSLTWEGGGLRLALGVDSYIYFANSRPAYRWACFGGGAGGRLRAKLNSSSASSSGAPSAGANASAASSSSMCLAYAFTKPDRLEQCVVFWNLKTDERHLKYVKRLISIHGSADGEYCVLVTGVDPSEADLQAQGGDPLLQPAASGPYGTPSSSQYILILCNSIGSPIDSKYVSVRPDHVAVTASHVCVASTDTLYVWQYSKHEQQTADGEDGSLREQGEDGGAEFTGIERVFHVDDNIPSHSAASLGAAGAGGTEVATARSAATMSASTTSGTASVVTTKDPICCITASDKHLLVARDSGAVLQFTLPSVTPQHKFHLRCRPTQLSLNCDSTRFSIIDINYTLSIFDMEATSTAASPGIPSPPPTGTDSLLSHGPAVGQHLPFEKKDVWQMIWAADYPDLWACMEKARMYIFRGTDPEEPSLSSGYLCRFDDLTITSVLLDDVMSQPDKPDRAMMVLAHETRSLRDSRMLLARTGIKDSAQFIEDNAHPRLWRLLAETALEKLDLNTAEKAYVACQDYPGIQFVKRLRLLHDKAKQRAEVLVYFKRSDEAESLYMGMDRRDLAIDMRMRMGQWAHVLRLLQPAVDTSASKDVASRAGADDATLALARTRLGDMLVDRQQWAKAIPFYEAAKAYDALVECYYITEDYASLQRLIPLLPEGAASSRLLLNIANKLQSVGLTDGAASAYLKAGDVATAVDCSVQLNQWDRAIQLAEKHKLPQIESLLGKYAANLVDSGKTIPAIELYRRANRDAESAKLLARLANDVAKLATSKQLQPLRVKKLHVLAALEVENHKRRTADALQKQNQQTPSVSQAPLDPRQTAVARTEAAMSNLLAGSQAESSAAAAAASRAAESAWHGAEAYHFFMLAQRQLYSGDILPAMITAQRLSLYEDILNPQDTYSLIALTSYYRGRFGACSKAFMKLEAIEAIPIADREAYGDLALRIFSNTRPVDPEESDSIICPTHGCSSALKPWSTNCMQCGCNFAACVATGRPLFSTSQDHSDDTWRCATCKHRAMPSSMEGRASCPLCHAATGPGS